MYQKERKKKKNATKTPIQYLPFMEKSTFIYNVLQRIDVSSFHLVLVKKNFQRKHSKQQPPVYKALFQ